MKRKTLSLFFVMLLSLIFSFSVSAEEISTKNEQSSSSDITWTYTKYDKNGNVVEEGVVPWDSESMSPRMYWGGITLANNEGVSFRPSGSQGLWAVKGTKVECSYVLSRSALHYAWVRSISVYGLQYYHSGTDNGSSGSVTATQDDYFLGYVHNQSSDPITVVSFIIKF